MTNIKLSLLPRKLVWKSIDWNAVEKRLKALEEKESSSIEQMIIKKNSSKAGQAKGEWSRTKLYPEIDKQFEKLWKQGFTQTKEIALRITRSGPIRSLFQDYYENETKAGKLKSKNYEDYFIKEILENNQPHHAVLKRVATIKKVIKHGVTGK